MFETNFSFKLKLFFSYVENREASKVKSFTTIKSLVNFLSLYLTIKVKNNFHKILNSFGIHLVFIFVKIIVFIVCLVSIWKEQVILDIKMQSKEWKPKKTNSLEAMSFKMIVIRHISYDIVLHCIRTFVLLQSY